RRYVPVSRVPAARRTARRPRQFWAVTGRYVRDGQLILEPSPVTPLSLFGPNVQPECSSAVTDVDRIGQNSSFMNESCLSGKSPKESPKRRRTDTLRSDRLCGGTVAPAAPTTGRCVHHRRNPTAVPAGVPAACASAGRTYPSSWGSVRGRPAGVASSGPSSP